MVVVPACFPSPPKQMAAFGKGFSGHQHYAKLAIHSPSSKPPRRCVSCQNGVYTWTTACPMATTAPDIVFLIIEKQQGP